MSLVVSSLPNERKRRRAELRDAGLARARTRQRSTTLPSPPNSGVVSNSWEVDNSKERRKTPYQGMEKQGSVYTGISRVWVWVFHTRYMNPAAIIAAGILFRVFFSNTDTRYIPAYTDPEIPIPGVTAAIDPTYPPRSPKHPSLPTPGGVLLKSPQRGCCRLRLHLSLVSYIRA
jgi:hypothetical protein